MALRGGSRGAEHYTVFWRTAFFARKKMKILALTTCTNDARYYRWIPHAKLFWNRLGFDFIVHFYGDKVPEGIERLGPEEGGGCRS